MHKKDYPRIPIATIVQRAIDLAVTCRRDSEELEKAGLDVSMVKSLYELSKGCSVAEARWVLTKERQAMRTQEFNEYIKECRRLRNSLAKYLKNVPGSEREPLPVPSYRKSQSRASLIQDLNDLAVICTTYQHRLTALPYIVELGSEASDTSKELSYRYARHVLQREEDQKMLQERNRLYYSLLHVIKEICGIGRHVFNNDPRKQSYHNDKRKL